MQGVNYNYDVEMDRISRHMDANAGAGLLIPLIEGRILEHLAPILVSLDSEDVGSGVPYGDDKVNQLSAPLGSRDYSIGRSMSGDYDVDP